MVITHLENLYYVYVYVFNGFKYHGIVLLNKHVFIRLQNAFSLSSLTKRLKKAKEREREIENTLERALEKKTR